MQRLSRRRVLGAAAAGAAVEVLGRARQAAAAGPVEPFGYCLNTATIRGQRLGIAEEIDVATQAGYGAIEPWIGSIRDYQKQGKSLKDLAKRIADAGLKVPGVVAFSRWIVDDEPARRGALEQLAGDMELVAQIGGTGIAAPPAGASRQKPIDLRAAGERFAAALELGDKTGVVPMLEIWGTNPTCGRLSEAVMVAVEAGHPKACILPDVYHLFRGGSDFDGLRMLGPLAMRSFHVNDYPADPPREQLNDGHRVMPGDGVAPLDSILRDLRAIGYRGWLSLELFSRDYWKQPAPEVAKAGLAKMKAAVVKALHSS